MIELLLLIIFEILVIILVGVFAIIGQYGAWIVLGAVAYFLGGKIYYNLSKKKRE